MMGLRRPLPTHTMSPVPTYILRSMLAGGVLGAGHGAWRGWTALKHDVPMREHRTVDHYKEYVGADAFNDLVYGVLCGPWAPVLIPAALFRWRSKDWNCSWVKRTLRLE
jgi:hypothetical protein